MVEYIVIYVGIIYLNEVVVEVKMKDYGIEIGIVGVDFLYFFVIDIFYFRVVGGVEFFF